MSARTSTAKPMRGARSEDSLLFTVKNLAAATAAPPAEACDVHGHAGSGLLDLEGLTRSYLEERGEGAVLGLGSELPGAVVVAAWQPGRPAHTSAIAIAFAAFTGVASAALILMAAWMWIMPRAAGAEASARQATAPASSPRAPGPPAPAVAVAAPAAALDVPSEAADPVSTAPTAAQPAAAPTAAQPAAAPAEQVAAAPVAERTRRPARSPAASRPRPRAAGTSTVSGPAAAECLDEVACLLASNPPACCTRAPSSQPRQAQAATPREDDPALPDRLDRAAIQAGIAQVRGRVAACERHGTGTVSLSVRVDGDGRVSAVEVKSSPSQALATCAAEAVEDARFARSRSGQRFVYPFVF